MCLEAIRSGDLIQRAAEKRYTIPRSTIKNKRKETYTKNVERVRIFSDEEEHVFEQHQLKLNRIKMPDYGFPLVEIDFGYAVKSYLDKKGGHISFLKRHENLTLRISSNIKKVRAEVHVSLIENYIDNLKEEVEDVHPNNIFKYDETNLTDDPGNKKVIWKEGAKYVDNICNLSKSATSILMPGNAAGDLLSPYFIYRAKHLCSTWTENGPEGTRCNHSKSGWFDAVCFDDWFQLPGVENLDGPKVIIGDNLSSHMSLHVLKPCEKNNIRFVCVPSNSTHLTQPLPSLDQ
ncbi:uncharacterized protein LOC130449025 [Diorhabda sublineata]|uniref:uncharacterized protein LOC130449025 n=1 Tax=Diorhabda sublineata TaxID=1163346 RepID=UPI0024E07BFE|nr:uncharacterized protein LOC130449025 [Diorhabda sublineata]